MLKQSLSALTLNITKLSIGSLGHLSIFLWALMMVLLPPLERGIIPALLALFVLGLFYPFAFRRLFSPRWLLILSSLLLINFLFGGQGQAADWRIFGLSISSYAVLSGMQMTFRAVVILVAVDGLSSSVNIIEVAGLLERGGLRGLGFSIGVATNLLPQLRQSSANAWYSLQMRGGLRAQRWRGLQLLFLTILTNALRHAEEIALAAEVRAFRPELIRKAQIRIGFFDWWMVVFGVLSLVGLIIFI